jgi:dTMP kinase
VTDILRDPEPPDADEPEAAPIPPHPDEDPAQAFRHALPSPSQPVGGGMSFSGFGEVLRIPDFRRLFIGQGISALGDWVGTLAFIVAAQQLAPNRPAAVALVLILRLLPSFFATPVGGVLSDRFDRKTIMVLSDLARFAVLLFVPLIPKLGALYIIAFVHECFSLFFLPARDASVPNIVPPDRLEAANALVMGSSFGGIPLSGPIFGGLAWVGAHYPMTWSGEHLFRPHPWAFAIFFDALTFIASAIFIQRMRIPQTADRTTLADEHMLDAAKEGVRYLMARPFLRGLAYAVTVAMLGGGVLFALGIGYVHETLGGGDVEFGWLMGIFGGGMVAGFLVSQMKPPGGVAWMVRITLFTMGSVLVFMGVFPWLYIGYILALVFGASFSTALIVAMSAVQARSDDLHRGRVMAAVHMLVRAALSIGALASGAIATFVPQQGIKIIKPTFDKNQVALLVAGGLIALGTLSVRGDPDAS